MKCEQHPYESSPDVAAMAEGLLEKVSTVQDWRSTKVLISITYGYLNSHQVLNYKAPFLKTVRGIPNVRSHRLPARTIL